MSFDINLIYQLVEEFHNTQLELTENDLRNTPKPEDTIFAILLEDSIEQLQHNYQNNIFDSEEIQSILNKLHYKPNNEEITQIGKILLDSKINHLKTINDNLNKGLYYKAKKVSCNNKITTIKENIQEVEEVNTIASTFDKYIQYQSNQDNWTNDTLQLNIRVFKLLNMYFKDKNLKDIKFDDLIDFRDTLLEVPLAYTTKNFFKDKDLEFIISNNDDFETLSNDTVNRYIIRTNQYLDYMYKLNNITKKILKFQNLVQTQRSGKTIQMKKIKKF